MQQSKKPQGSHKDQVWKFISESNKIEGIDIDKSVFNYILGGDQHKTAPDPKDLQHVKNSMEAYEYVKFNFDTDLDIDSILVMHELQMWGLMKEEYIGELRTKGVGIRKSRIDFVECSNDGGIIPVRKFDFIPCLEPDLIEGKLREFIRSFNNSASGVLDSHYEFECIHPFIDGNGRVGRLIWLWSQFRLKSKKDSILEEFEGKDFSERKSLYYDAIQNYRDTRFEGSKYGKDGSTEGSVDRGLKKRRGKPDAEDATNNV